MPIGVPCLLGPGRLLGVLLGSARGGSIMAMGLFFRVGGSGKITRSQHNHLLFGGSVMIDITQVSVINNTRLLGVFMGSVPPHRNPNVGQSAQLMWTKCVHKFYSLVFWYACFSNWYKDLTAVVSVVFSTAILMERKLLLIHLVLDPMKVHAHCLAFVWMHRAVDYSLGSGVISLDGCGWLWVSHFSLGEPYLDSLPCIDV